MDYFVNVCGSMELINHWRNLYLLTKDEKGQVATGNIIGAEKQPTLYCFSEDCEEYEVKEQVITPEEAERMVAEHLAADVHNEVLYQNTNAYLYTWYHSDGYDRPDLQRLLSGSINKATNGSYVVFNAQCGNWKMENNQIYYQNQHTGYGYLSVPNGKGYSLSLIETEPEVKSLYAEFETDIRNMFS